MTIDEWWRGERLRRFNPDPGLPAYPWDALGNPSPCPWAYAMTVPTDPRFFNWQRLADGIKALYRKARR